MEAFIVTGIPGAGKTATSRALAARFPRGVHVEGDVLRFDFVVSGLADPFGSDAERREWDRQMQLGRRHEAMIATSFAGAGFVAVIDDVITHPNALRQVTDALAARPVRLVVLAPPLEVAAARDAQRDKHVFDTWRHLDQQLRDAMAGLGLWIEDGYLGVDEVVDLILDGKERATILGA